jgi:hypothetical protein
MNLNTLGAFIQIASIRLFLTRLTPTYWSSDTL